ncbi:transcriptional Coactivator p15-domain-containing protein [Chiua virens]|nr:transcriptional Coactivator p15-domain-containing protein [Chiua virens]
MFLKKSSLILNLRLSADPLFFLQSPPVHEESKQRAIKVLENAEGNKYVDLGKNKHASVRSFKGAVFLDIREFYDGKPGKKGITLSNEQWEILKQGVSTIDSSFAECAKK